MLRRLNSAVVVCGLSLVLCNSATYATTNGACEAATKRKPVKIEESIDVLPTEIEKAVELNELYGTNFNQDQLALLDGLLEALKHPERFSKADLLLKDKEFSFGLAGKTLNKIIVNKKGWVNFHLIYPKWDYDFKMEVREQTYVPVSAIQWLHLKYANGESAAKGAEVKLRNTEALENDHSNVNAFGYPKVNPYASSPKANKTIVNWADRRIREKLFDIDTATGAMRLIEFEGGTTKEAYVEVVYEENGQVYIQLSSSSLAERPYPLSEIRWIRKLK